MISIHLRRTGAKKDPHYRVVVADSRDARDGSFIEVLGHYHPRFTPARVTLDLERIKSWIAKGAQPSDTIKSLMRQVESGKLDALPDLPKLDPIPVSSMEADDMAAVEPAPEEIPEVSDASSASAATSTDESEPGDALSDAETADFAVPAAEAEEAGAQDAGTTEAPAPDKAQE